MPINETKGTRTIKNFPSKCALRHQTYKWGVECRGSEPALLRRKVAKAAAPCAAAGTANVVYGKRVGTTLNVCIDTLNDS